ncbi:MAG: hypothetical protein EAZ91_11600 [Cytophagales bacterium]|nr:MAG: hypothetical protein EAZ91_11600 [Cytophagales bacterium]
MINVFALQTLNVFLCSLLTYGTAYSQICKPIKVSHTQYNTFQGKGGIAQQAQVINNNYYTKTININIFIFENGKTEIYDSLIPIEAKEQPKNEATALNAVKNLSDSIRLCYGDLVNIRIREGRYSIFKNAQNKRFIKVPTSDDELISRGLKVIYPESNGISRVREGRGYYYQKGANCLSVNKYNECDRFPFATDFDNGVAIIGRFSIDTTYYFVNSSGQRNENGFVSYEKNFAGNIGVFKLKMPNGKYLLTNSKQEKLTTEFEKIELLMGRYILVTSNNKSGLLQKDGDFFSLVIDVEYDSFLILSRYHNLILGKKGTDFCLLDGENKCQNLITTTGDFNDESEETVPGLLRFNSKGLTGAFIIRDRTVISPKYQTITFFNQNLNYLKCKIDGKFTYINLSGVEIVGRYYFIEDKPDYKGYIRVKEDSYKWGFTTLNSASLSVNGFVIKPYYAYVTNFGNRDLAWASISDNNVGLVDRKGKFIDLGEIIYSFNEYDEPPTSFNKYGISFARRFPTSAGFNSVVSYKGRVLVRNNDQKFVLFDTENSDVCLITDSSKYLFVKDGDLIASIYDFVGKPDRNGFRQIKLHGKLGILDHNFKELYTCQFDSVVNSIELKLFWGLKNSTYALYSYTSGGTEPVSANQFRSVRSFVGNYALGECARGGFCFIDPSGISTDCLAYQEMSDAILNKYAIVTLDNYKGIINIHDAIPYLSPKCTNIEFKNGQFICTYQNKAFTLNSHSSSSVLNCIDGDCDTYYKILK